MTAGCVGRTEIIVRVYTSILFSYFNSCIIGHDTGLLQPAVLLPARMESRKGTYTHSSFTVLYA